MSDSVPSLDSYTSIKSVVYVCACVRACVRVISFIFCIFFIWYLHGICYTFTGWLNSGYRYNHDRGKSLSTCISNNHGHLKEMCGYLQLVCLKGWQKTYVNVILENGDVCKKYTRFLESRYYRSVKLSCASEI